MKQPKAPTRAQKEIIYNHKLNPNNWMVTSETETTLNVIYKFGKTTRELDKSVNKWKGETK